MPRRNRTPRARTWRKPEPIEDQTPDPTPWHLAVQLVKAGKAPVDILRGGSGDL